jgi:Carboxypeptidase regulatory-like domain
MPPNLLTGNMIEPVIMRQSCLRRNRFGRGVLLAVALNYFLYVIGSQAQAQSEAPVPIPATLVSSEPAEPPPGSISGAVVDKDGASIPNAKIQLATHRLNSNESDSRETVTGQDGHFSFANVASGPFQITVSASGFATQTQKGMVPEGAEYVVPNVQLIVATEVDVEVRVDPVEVAEEQIHAEETQRVFGIVPNFYVTYVPNASPLDRHQKLELAWKSVVDPVTIGLSAALAGVEQADDAFSGYGQGAQGYAKRFGASYADLVSGTFIGSAILPIVFKQDPRYFYKGTGTKKSRFLYAVANAVICKGDNGRWQANYSNMVGSLAAGAISNIYYPASNRNGVGLTFENALIGIGGSAIGAVIEEFFLRKVTPHAPSTERAVN